MAKTIHNATVITFLRKNSFQRHPMMIPNAISDTFNNPICHHANTYSLKRSMAHLPDTLKPVGRESLWRGPGCLDKKIPRVMDLCKKIRQPKIFLKYTDGRLVCAATVHREMIA